MLRVLAMILTMSWALGSAAQNTFRWVDKDGRVHYTDQPPQQTARSVENRRLNPNVVETSRLDYATQQAIKNFPVSLYTAPSCKEPCDKARELLNARGVPFNEIAVKEEAQRQALQAVSGDNQVPVLVVGKDVQKGFEAGAFHAALDGAGYAKSGKAPQTVAGQQAAKPAPKPAAEANAQAPETAAKKGRYAP